MFPVFKETIVRNKWHQHCQRMNAFREVCFQLIAHPDTTPEQMGTVVRSIMHTQQAHDTLRAKLIADGYL